MIKSNLYLIASRLQKVEGGESPRFDRPTGGGDNGGMEARVARLEADVDYIKRDIAEIKTILNGHGGKFDGVRDRIDGLRDRTDRDFRILFGALTAASLGLAGLMAKGFGWL